MYYGGALRECKRFVPVLRAEGMPMTEAEWLESAESHTMLGFLRGKASDRKLRLFACACCRRIWRLLTDGRSRGAVEIAEQYADDPTRRGRDRLIWARDEARVVKRLFATANRNRARGSRGANAAQDVTRDTGISAALNCMAEASRAVNTHDTNECDDRELREQAVLLRDLFGPLPFRPVAHDPSWLAWNGGTVSQLAQAVYNERELPSGHLDTTRLALMADMLEDAGCTDPEILQHLRDDGPHVRGCWVVDLLLGKA